MKICSACGHALTPAGPHGQGPCGFASITVGEKTTYLCHADDHSCYMEDQPVSVYTKYHLPAPVAAMGLHRKTALTPMVYMEGPFTVVTQEGEYELPEGWQGFVAVDKAGYPYPIALAEYNETYEQATHRPLPDAAEGNRETDSHRDDSEPATPASGDAVRDLAAPSNGSVSSRPSPGADPRPKAVVYALQDDENDFGVWRTNTTIATLILAAADAADRAAGIIRVDTREKATVDFVARAVGTVSNPVTRETVTRAVLAALRGEQP